MNQKVQNEIAKIKKNANATVGGSFTGSDGSQMLTRSSELVQFKGGDILTFPTDLTDQVVTVPVRGAKDEEGNQVYAKYIPVSVQRTVGSKTVEKVIPFYPSSFWKRRQQCDLNGKWTGTWHNASGEVAEMVADYATVDEAIVAIGQHGPVKVTVDTFKTLPFGAEEGSKPINSSVMQFNWATPAVTED